MTEPTLPRAPVLMIQGTASHAGKTVIAAALCRIFRRRGWRVAPFKAQNLSLNAVVVAGDRGRPPGEIAWAQALQAAACRITPTLDMNPVLLKPSKRGCQLVVGGRAQGELAAGEYGAYSPAVLEEVGGALNRLRAAHDLVIIEGGGSPAEINLRNRDLANAWIAAYADAPILLVGDIERGGVFASLLGTWTLAPEPRRIRGFIVNKLHGGAASLQPGLDELQARTGVATLGVIPWRDPELPAEDSLGIDAVRGVAAPPHSALRVVVVRWPHLSNFTDFDELAREPGVHLVVSWEAAVIAAADVLILPGSKSTVADLEAMRAAGLDRAVVTAAATGTPVLGICAGYQVLGSRIYDPDGVEADVAETPGLDLLPVETRFGTAKITLPRHVQSPAGNTAAGYFIHFGEVRRLAGGEAWLSAVDGGADEGCRVGPICGTALHGLLAAPALRREIIATWRVQCGRPPAVSEPESASLDKRLEAWADHVEAHVPWETIYEIVHEWPKMEMLPGAKK